jgi:ABC-2 type transport system ATP-binding protein
MSELGNRITAIETQSLTKRYGEHVALDSLSLTVEEGSMYGFLGPNGAGKTTTIRLLLGFIRPTSGVGRIFGHETWSDGVAARRSIGFLVQADAFYRELSGEAQLDYAAHLSGAKPVLRRKLLDALHLSDRDLKRRLRTYSKGMRQKLALTAAMQHDPPLLILDEPADGLDPLIQRSFETVLKELQQAGRTVFMSSHDLAEVERTCDRLAVIRQGVLVAEETVQELQRRHRRRAEVLFRQDPSVDFDRVPGVHLIHRDNRRVTLLVDQDVNPLIQALASEVVEEISLTPPSLDDIFMAFYQLDGETKSNAVALDEPVPQMAARR